MYVLEHFIHGVATSMTVLLFALSKENSNKLAVSNYVHNSLGTVIFCSNYMIMYHSYNPLRKVPT